MDAIVWYTGPKMENDDFKYEIENQYLMIRLYPADIPFIDFKEFHNYVYNIRDNSKDSFEESTWEISTYDIKENKINIRYSKKYKNNHLDIYNKIEPILTELIGEYNEYKRSI